VRGSSLALVALAALSGCGLSERADFLVGRQCDPTAATPCDEAQSCLPHRYADGELDEFRCRDRASFEPRGGQEAPLAYCDEAEGYLCPGDLVCNADRIRLDAGFRPRVCKPDGDPFAPPLDAGPSW